METKKIENFYNQSLTNSQNKYEFDRWSKTSQGRASYKATRTAFYKHVAPLLGEISAGIEVGPGPGTWTKEIFEISPNIEMDLVDISEQMLLQAKENIGSENKVNFIHQDFTEFTPHRKYDLFFSSRFLEYAPNKSDVIAIVESCLNVGGMGYLVTKTPQYKRPFSKVVTAPIHQGQISADELVDLLKQQGLIVKAVVNVTSVFPGLRSGLLDSLLTKLCNFLPFNLVKIVSESYAVIFVKK